jgi:hypothetical protein
MAIRSLLKRQFGRVDATSSNRHFERSETEDAHKHCIHHRAELERSDSCGCFYCFAIFPPSAITEWVDDGQTAICPFCPADSVIGSASNYPITREFLEAMHGHWF